MTGRRSRIVRLGLMVGVVVLGLGSRRFGRRLPGVVAVYAGDTLWATAVFLGFSLLMTKAPTWAVALPAMAFSVFVEISQLYKAPWIDSIRRTALGGLVLGNDFVWSDLVCYTVGVGLGMLIELAVGHLRREPGR